MTNWIPWPSSTVQYGKLSYSKSKTEQNKKQKQISKQNNQTNKSIVDGTITGVWVVYGIIAGACESLINNLNLTLSG